MLWVLLPLTAITLLAGPLILSIYGPAFRAGSMWLGIVAVACGTNAFASLAETAIMVQRPRLNLRNSVICCVIAVVGNVFLIRRFGALGAAFGILLPYIVFALLRYQTLRAVFGWRNPFRNTHPPLLAALLAGAPAILCRLVIDGVASHVVSLLVFGGIYFVCWRIYRARNPQPSLV
jgi:O-antigen/teichoic acid export membrane protein